MSNLMKRVIKDIKQNPERLDVYLSYLAQNGMLKGKTLKVASISTELLEELKESTIILK